MKIVLSLLLVAGLVSATSIKRFDRWSCNFPNRPATGIVKGTLADLEYDFGFNQGKALIYPDCPVCHVMPREISVQRTGGRNSILFNNNKEGVNIVINWSAYNKPNGPYTAFYGRVSGTCTPTAQ